MAWSCRGSRHEQSSGFSGVGRFSWFAVAGRRGRLPGPLGLRSQRSATRKSRQCRAHKSLGPSSLTKGLRSTRGGRRSSLQTTRGGNPRRRQWAPRPNFRPRASARVISTRDRMAELTAKKPRRTRQPTEKRLPVSSPARATEITPQGGSPSHSLARPHRVAARRESARGQRAAPETRPRRRWPLEAHAAPPAHPAGTPMSPTCAAAWKTPLAQPGRGAFA